MPISLAICFHSFTLKMIPDAAPQLSGHAVLPLVPSNECHAHNQHVVLVDCQFGACGADGSTIHTTTMMDGMGHLRQSTGLSGQPSVKLMLTLRVRSWFFYHLIVCPWRYIFVPSYHMWNWGRSLNVQGMNCSLNNMGLCFFISHCFQLATENSMAPFLAFVRFLVLAIAATLIFLVTYVEIFSVRSPVHDQRCLHSFPQRSLVVITNLLS